MSGGWASLRQSRSGPPGLCHVSLRLELSVPSLSQLWLVLAATFATIKLSLANVLYSCKGDGGTEYKTLPQSTQCLIYDLLQMWSVHPALDVKICVCMQKPASQRSICASPDLAFCLPTLNEMMRIKVHCNQDADKLSDEACDIAI